MSNDLRKLPAEAKAILQNKLVSQALQSGVGFISFPPLFREVIAVNQDKLGIQGRRISTSLYRNPGLGEAEVGIYVSV